MKTSLNVGAGVVVLAAIALTQVSFVAVGSDTVGSTFLVLKREQFSGFGLFESDESRCKRASKRDVAVGFSANLACHGSLAMAANRAKLLRLPHSGAVVKLSLAGNGD